MVPVRGEEPGFAAALNATFPFPVPLPAEVMLIHESFAEAVQLHDVPAVTLKLPGPPPAAMLAVPGLIEYVQGMEAATINVTGTVKGELLAASASKETAPL